MMCGRHLGWLQVAVQSLLDAVSEVASEWGFSQEAVEQAFLCERLLGTGGKVSWQVGGHCRLPLSAEIVQRLGARWPLAAVPLQSCTLIPVGVSITNTVAEQVTDDSGKLYVTFSEFMLFLELENVVVRVMHAVRHHRAEVGMGQACFTDFPPSPNPFAPLHA